MQNEFKANYAEQQLAKALIELLKNNDLDKISIRELCDRAGVGRATFYRHYHSKEEILERHAQFLIMKWTNEMESDPNAKPWDIFESLFRHIKKHRTFYEVLHKTGKDSILRTSLREKIGMTGKLSNEEAYDKVFFADGISGWIEEWIERGMQETPVELNSALYHYFNEVLSNLGKIFTYG